MPRLPFRQLTLLWLAWAALVVGFQVLVGARLQPQWPDRALKWTTEGTTTAAYQNPKPYLLDPFLNNHVAWDSEYYLAIAVGGYDDPKVQAIGPADKPVSLSYAFFPFYPLLIKLMAFPLSLFGLTPVATATLAGVLVSALGAWLGMVALYDLAHTELGETGALRAAFYLLIFPTGFFMLQVYTEGLFVGLAFASLALMRRRQWVFAALLGMCATWTRAVGIALVIPMAYTWLLSGEWQELDLEWRQIYYHGLPRRALWHGLVAFAPLIAFLLWKFSYLGLAFDFVEANFFGRGFMNLGLTYYNWFGAFTSMLAGTVPAHSAYYLIEFGAIVLGFVACFACFRTHPEVAWFSLAVVVISLTSGPAQGMHRYILAAPAVFLALGRWGQNPTFDRAWTLISLLLMGLLAMLFTFNMWVA